MKSYSKQGSLKTMKSTSTKSLLSKVKSGMRMVGAKSLEQYYEDLESVQPRIDNKPPKFDIDVYYKPRTLEANTQTVMEIDRNNLELLKKLNTIHRMGGYVDCWNFEFKYKPPLIDKQTDIDKIINENRQLMTKIEQVTSVYCTADLMREWRNSRAATKISSKDRLSNKSRSKLQLIKKKISPSLNEITTSRNVEDLTRPRCYFEIEIENEHRRLGKITFQLFAEVVPKTCENFMSFCKGVDGRSYKCNMKKIPMVRRLILTAHYEKKVALKKIPPSFRKNVSPTIGAKKGTPFHRILPGYWCQGGDVTKFNGSGGTSIYGDTFEDENFELRHSEPGILSMCSYGKNLNNSKFNLTFKKLETVDGKQVVFGKLISGITTLRELERFGTNHGRPAMKIIVSKCGVL